MKGLFLNTVKAKCSIYESGKMSYDCLSLSKMYFLDYQEIDKDNRRVKGGYDFYIFNYHPTAMSWLDLSFVKKLPGLKITLVLEVDVNNPFCLCPDNIFDAYLVLDPTLVFAKKNVYAFPRPLEVEKKQAVVWEEPTVPTIGSFGFYGDGKGFNKLIDAVNKEFDEAIIKINTLNPDWGGDSKKFDEFVDYLKQYPTKEGVKVVVTSCYFSKMELVDWCSKNTLNAFFYNRHSQGLSATTDQAIASGRPLSISTCFTFRHIQEYIKPYPFVSLKETLKNGTTAVKRMQDDWSQIEFVRKFELVLKENIVNNETMPCVNVSLAVIRNTVVKGVLKKIIPARIVNFLVNIKNSLALSNPNNLRQGGCNLVSTLPTFVHPAVNSYGRSLSDLYIDFLLGQKAVGSYIDINSGNPVSDNNSYRFYKRGWRGTNIIFDLKTFDSFEKFRSSDINIKFEKNEDNTIDLGKLSKVLAPSLSGQEVEFMCLTGGKELLSILRIKNWAEYRPKIIIIDCITMFEPIRFFMEDNDYMNILNTGGVAFFVDKFTVDNNILKVIKWNIRDY